jgi:uncharacterized membrane protein
MASIPIGWNASFVPTGMSLGVSSGTNRSSILLTISVAPNAANGTLHEFTAILRSQQAAVSVSWRVTVRVLLPSSDIHEFNMTADRSLASATGGANVTFLVTVQNVGNVQDAFSFAFAGVPIGWNWTVIGGFTHTIAPQASVTVSLVVTTAAGALARSFDLEIVVNASGGGATSKSIPVTVEVREHREIRLVATAEAGVFEPGATVTVALTLFNLGNVGETVRLDGSGPFASISYDPRQLHLDPFGQTTASVSIVLRGDQPAGNLTFGVRATSIDDSNATSQAQLEVQVGPGTHSPPGPSPGFPPMVGDAGLILLLVMAGGVAGVALFLARRRRDRGGGNPG